MAMPQRTVEAALHPCSSSSLTTSSLLKDCRQGHFILIIALFTTVLLEEQLISSLNSFTLLTTMQLIRHQEIQLWSFWVISDKRVYASVCFSIWNGNDGNKKLWKNFKWLIAIFSRLEELADHSYYCLLHDTSTESLFYSAFEIQN